MEKCLYKRFKGFKNFNDFFMYLFRGRKGGGCTNACIYVWEHIVISLYYRTARWMFKKLGRDSVFIAPHMH